MIDRLAASLRSLVTRGKVTDTTISGRTLLQATMLDEEDKQSVELLLPPGYSARPAIGSDVLLLQVLGSRDHIVALGGDQVGQAIADLAAGEFGLRGNGRQIVMRIGGIEIQADGETLRKLVTDAFVPFFNAHTHGGGAVPDQTMGAAHLTATTEAGGP